MSLKTIQSSLSAHEVERLAECKKIVMQGLKSYVETGIALAEIRDSKLYRQNYDTFEEFCRCEFKIERRRAYQLIEAAEVKEALPPEMCNKLHNESQARALAAVPVVDRTAVLEVASQGGPPTAVKITAAAKAIEPIIELDKTGHPIPAEVLTDWQRAEAIAAGAMRELSDLKCAVAKALGDKNVVFAAVNNALIADLSNAYSGFKLVMPFAVCSTCQGRNRSMCVLCKRRGYLDRFSWDSLVPQEVKDIRAKANEK